MIPHLARPRHRGERGAVLVEMAFVGPILIILAFGIVEFGGAWQYNTRLQTATRGAARTASNEGTSRSADYDGLLSIQSTLGSKVSNVQRVVVYKADASDGAVPTACKTGSVSGVCNSYPGSIFTTMTASSFSGSCSSSLDRYWCPTTRDDSADSADYLGIWIQYQYTFVTHLFPGGGLTLTRSTVMRIEPSS